MHDLYRVAASWPFRGRKVLQDLPFQLESGGLLSGVRGDYCARGADIAIGSNGDASAAGARDDLSKVEIGELGDAGVALDLHCGRGGRGVLRVQAAARGDERKRAQPKSRSSYSTQQEINRPHLVALISGAFEQS